MMLTTSEITKDHSNSLTLLTRLVAVFALLTGLLYGRVFASRLVSFDGASIGTAVMLALLLLAGTGLLLGWRWLLLGGLLALMGGVGLGLMAFVDAATMPLLTAVFYGSPFVISAVLTLILHFREQR